MRFVNGRKMVVVVIVAVAGALASLLAPASGQGPPAIPAGPNGPELGSPSAELFVNGQEGIDRLGLSLARVAQEGDMSAEALRREMLLDPTLYVDPNGHLVYFDIKADEGSPVPADDGPVEAPPTDGPEFQLESLPGADKTIYLDFDGHTTTGTRWNTAYGVTNIVSPPYDISGNTEVWSQQELNIIKDTWAVVAEDYAAFDVNVTTKEPPLDDLRRTSGADNRYGARVIMTVDNFAGCGCGGFAYPGSFSDSVDTPTFVFNSGFVGLSEAASHEVGHMVWMSHDGVGTTTYYFGHSGGGVPSWAPIMGAAYSVDYGSWSFQEYTNANNNTASANYGFGRDDLAVIGSLSNGNNFGFRPDDHGGVGSPTPLVGGSPSVDGIIGNSNDVDAFSFTTSGGTVSFDAVGDDVSSNLDILLTLRNSGGGIVASSNPAASMSASLSANVGAGTYTVSIDGVGAGNPQAASPTGYTDYSSIGQYNLSGTIPGVGGPARLTLLDAPCVAASGNLSANSTATETVTGTCGVPNSGVTAALVSLNAVDPAGVGNLRLSAAGVTPEGGVVNYNANNLDNGNTVIVPLSGSGAVDITANVGATGYRLVVLGYMSNSGNLRYNPVTPCAFADSRSGQGPTGGFVGPFAAGAAYPDTDVVGNFSAGQGGGNTNCGVPSGADAVMVNVVSVGGTGGTGGLAVGTGGTEPSVATTSFAPIGLNNAVSMVVPLDGGQTIATNILSTGGSPSTHIRLVVLGYYDTAGSDYTTVNACAIFDTRPGQGASGGYLGKRNDGGATNYQITGSPSGQGGVGGCGVPNGADAVLINLVSIQPDAVGNFRAYATGSSPTGGVLNFAPTSPAMNNSNAVVVPLSNSGQMSLFTNAPSASGGSATHARGVVLGYFD